MSSGSDIRNLHQESKEVGKTIKSSKKYFVWEFNIDSKFYKVEMFHSKISGKKKLILDKKILTEAKSYSNDFIYSFKIDKHYLNVDQIGSDNFVLRIDNRSFTVIQTEEKLKSKAEAKESSVKPSNSNANPRNAEANFFNENDFEFDDCNKTEQNNNQESHTFVNPNNNNIAEPEAQSNNICLLIDFGGEADKNENKNNQETGLFSQLQRDKVNINNNLNNNISDNQHVYQDVLNNNQKPVLQNINCMNNFNHLGFNPTFNLNANGIHSNGFRLNLDPNKAVNNNANYGTNLSQNSNIGFNAHGFDNNNNYGNGNDNNIHPSVYVNNNKESLLQNNTTNNFGFSNLKDIKLNESQNNNIINNYNNNNNNNNQVQQQENQFKDKILGNGLINLDRLLDDNDIALQRKHSQPQTTYKFDLTGAKLEVNPNTLSNNPIGIPNAPTMNTNINNIYQYNMNQGYRMPIQAQPMMHQQMNPNMFMMNNYSQMPMNFSYPQQEQFNNYPNSGYNQNMGYNMPQPIFNQNIPIQQNKAANPKSVLDFFN